jgi:hypothetical protein
VPVLTIPTYRRPAPLYALLASLGSGEYRDTPESITIFDDDPAGAPETQALIARINREYGLSVEYTGSHEKKLLAEKLAAQKPELSVPLNFAFWGMESIGGLRADGMNRNAILLYHRGKKVVSADDDTVFSYLAFKKPETVLEKLYAGCNQKSHKTRQEQPFYAFSEKHWEGFKKHLVPYYGNPFLEFDRVLGSSANNSPAGNKTPPGPVRIAMSGIFGGPWYSSPLAILDIKPPRHALMWNNRRTYHEARNTPRALYLSPATRFSAGDFFAAAHIAYDSSVLLPPFLPHIRNDDGIWAFITRRMYPASPVCHLPFAISHGRTSHSSFESGYIRISVTASGLFRLLISLFNSRILADTPERYLVSLGDELCAATDLPEQNWRELSMELFLSMQSRYIAELEQTLEESPAKNSLWKEELSSHIAALKRDVSSCTPWIPAEFSVFGNRGESLFREYLRRSGELFLVWPELWRKA